MSLLLENHALLSAAGNGLDKGIYTVEELYTMIGSENYIPVANASEFEASKTSISQTMGLGTIFQATYLTGWDKKYVQIRHIDLTGNDWEGLASSSVTYDGNGLMINNATIDGAIDVNSLFGTGNLITLKNIIATNLSSTGSGLLISSNNTSSIIENCHVSGSITSNVNFSGGICGNFYGTISKCTFNGDITDVSGAIGGICGSLYGTVSQCYASGNLSGLSSVGGMVGWVGSGGVVENCWSASNTTASGTNSGSLVGVNQGTIRYSYSYGSAVGSSDYGGLCGANAGVVTNSYWDTEASGNATSSGGTGKTTVQMKEGLIPDTSIYVSWDDTIWNAGTTSQYPFLINNN